MSSSTDAYVPPTPEEVARLQSAVADAHDAWVEQQDASPPPATMSPVGPSEYPANAYLIDADADAQDSLRKAVSDAVAGAGRPLP